MSCFTKAWKAKKAAKKFKKEKKVQNEQCNQKQEPAPYRHIPTHAGIDAMNGAHSTYKAEDAIKIRADYDRRSQLRLAGTPSTLSTVQTPVSFRNGSAANSICLPESDEYIRTKSGQSLPMKPRQRRTHSSRDLIQMQSPLTSRSQSRADLLALQEEAPSTSTSSSSLDHLEMKIKVNDKPNPPSVCRGLPKGPTVPEEDIFKSLHHVTTRKVGEAPKLEQASLQGPIMVNASLKVAAPSTPKKNKWFFFGRKDTTDVIATQVPES